MLYDYNQMTFWERLNYGDSKKIWVEKGGMSGQSAQDF